MEFNSDKNRNTLLKAYNMLLYFAGSMIMYEPVEECVVDFWSKGILKALPVRSSNPRFNLAASQLRESCKDKIPCKSMLKDDYDKLLSGTGQPLAPPLKSIYTDLSLEEGLGEEKVSDFYNAYGWMKRTRYNIPDDNLGIELLFLTLLNDKYIALDDEACRSEMRNEIRRFIKQHILSWIPDWNDRIQDFAATLCYKGIATLIYASCEDIYELMGNSKPEMKFNTEFRN
jgi:TorA maturation chaperone TorD